MSWGKMNNLYKINELNDKDDADFRKKCTLISEDIKGNKVNMMDLIKEMGTFLTNPAPSKRELGVSILKEVLRNLPQDLLNKQQLEVITAFFAEKLKDHHQILPCALEGILIIINFDNFPSECIPILLTGIFQNISCQQQQRIDRYNIYSIFEKLLEKFPSVILAMRLDFVFGVITTIDGERDPRNLLFLFRWLKILLNKISLGHLSEEMFDVIACYFPVDFKAPPNEQAISREVLAEALCPCLCGNSDFGESCITLALEKLDSSLDIAKLDSLKLLHEGCKSFEIDVYLTNASNILVQLQKEIFSNNNSDIRLHCLQTLSCIINKISQSDKVNVILRNIFEMTKGNLFSESKLFEASIDILLYTAKGSEFSSNYVLKEVVPLLTNTYNITINSCHKAQLLKYLVQFVEGCECYNTNGTPDNDILNSIAVFSLKATMDQDTILQVAGFDGLSDLASYLPTDVRTVLYNNLCKLVVQPLESNLRKSMLNCFLNLAITYEVEFREYMLNKVVVNDSVSLELFLDAKCILINLPKFREFVVDSLICYLDNNTFLTVSVKIIKKLLSENRNNPEISKLLLEKSVIDILLKFDSRLSGNVDTQLLIDISSILKRLIGPQDSDLQRKIVYSHLDGVFIRAQQFELDIILLNGLIAKLRIDIELGYSLVDFLLNIALNSTNDLVRDISVQLLCIILNKKTSDEPFNNYIQKAQKYCVYSLSTHTENKLTAFSWITKALLMKNHTYGYKCVDMLLDMLEKHKYVAQGFRIIINDNYECIDPQSHCVKMLLYRQKLFVYVSNKIINNFSISSLKVMGYLMEYAPQQAVLLQFKKMMQLIIMCLENCKEEDVICTILHTIKNILVNNANILEDHVDDLLTRILNLTTYENSMIIRIEALQCLLNYTTAFPVYKLLPSKSTVLFHLSRCIDDKKRLVRREAMEARSLWFLLDAPI